MPDSLFNQPLYTSRMRTSIYGRRLGLDDDGMLIGPPALKGDVRTLTTVPTTVAAHGNAYIAATGSSQGPVQHHLAAPIPGVDLAIFLNSTSTGSHQFLSTPNGASIRLSSVGTTGGVVNFVGPGGSIVLTGLTTALWGIKSMENIASTALAGSITFTTST